MTDENFSQSESELTEDTEEEEFLTPEKAEYNPRIMIPERFGNYKYW